MEVAWGPGSPTVSSQQQRQGVALASLEDRFQLGGVLNTAQVGDGLQAATRVFHLGSLGEPCCLLPDSP